MTDIKTIRHLIKHQLQSTPQFFTASTPSKYQDIDPQAWWLLGTSGCHLCDDADKMLRLFLSVCPVPVQHIDIADLDESLMAQFATVIPVILTPTQQLNYPFSMLDLQRLAEQ